MTGNSTLKEKLYDGINLYGTWCLLPSEEVVNVIGRAGMDFVIVDQEHGAIDWKTAQRMVIGSQAEGCSAIIRVGDSNEIDILHALDVGADGVIVPHIENVKDAENAVSFAKYPPLGERGFSPYARSGGYTNQKGYAEHENSRILIGVIVEGKEGINSVREIAEVDGVDLIYIGTYDISSVLGMPGETTNPVVLNELTKCVNKIHDVGKIPGCMFSSYEEISFFDENKINFRVYDVDSSVIFRTYKDALTQIGGKQL